MKKYLLTRQKDDVLLHGQQQPALAQTAAADSDDHRTLLRLADEDEYGQPYLGSIAPSILSPVVQFSHAAASFPLNAACDFEAQLGTGSLQLPLQKYQPDSSSPVAGSTATATGSAFNVIGAPQQARNNTPPYYSPSNISFMCRSSPPGQTPTTPFPQQQQPEQTSLTSASTAAGLMALHASSLGIERLGPQILRSQPSTVGMKQIPNNDPTDLLRHRRLHPIEWSMDDVIAWMLSVAREYQIPHEALSITSFVGLNGQLMMMMNQQQFVDRDRRYGYLFYKEFKKIVGDDSSLRDDWMQATEQQPEASGQQQQQRQCPSNSFNLLANSLLQSDHLASPSTSGAVLFDKSRKAGVLGSFEAMTAARRLDAKDPDALFDSMPPLLTMANKMKRRVAQDQPSASAQSSNNIAAAAASLLSATAAAAPPNPTVKPRRRSQHTKGNKLWEFIRDALKDPLTCPSVVRWEDQEQGVFRIVESERLARMWGEKKNNHKMTYEKLSRAMRTYYDKQILSPVPKTGMYPKKLVYKFGPMSHGWREDGTPLPVALAALPAAAVGSQRNSTKQHNKSEQHQQQLQAAAAAAQQAQQLRLLQPPPLLAKYNIKTELNDTTDGDDEDDQEEYYYNTQILLPVSGRRLVYKFGPNASNWLDDAGNDETAMAPVTCSSGHSDHLPMTTSESPPPSMVVRSDCSQIYVNSQPIASYIMTDPF